MARSDRVFDRRAALRTLVLGVGATVGAISTPEAGETTFAGETKYSRSALPKRRWTSRPGEYLAPAHRSDHKLIRNVGFQRTEAFCSAASMARLVRMGMKPSRLRMSRAMRAKTGRSPKC